MAETTYSLPVLETVKAAWEKVKGTKGTFWAIIGIFIVVMLILSLIANGFAAAGLTWIAGIFKFASILVQMFIGWGLIYTGIQRALDFPIRYRMITYVFDLTIFLYMIGFYILRVLVLLPSGLVLGAGIGLFHLPDNGFFNFLGVILFLLGLAATIYLSVRMWIGQAFILDKKINPWQALKLTFNATRDNFWNLIGLVFINLLIAIACALTLGIGLIWGIPYFCIMYGELYKKLYVGRQMVPA